jgi:hypothetical protein
LASGRAIACKLWPLSNGYECMMCDALATEHHHRDGDELNNTEINVEMLCGRCHRHLSPTLFKNGELHPSAKLTADQVIEIRERHADGVSQGALGREFGVHRTSIRHIIRGVNWGHLPLSPTLEITTNGNRRR